MSLARAMKRKLEKQAATGDLRAAKSYLKAKKSVRHATTREIVEQTIVRRQAVAEIMMTMVVAVHRTFGWGMDRILRLRKKMRVETECLKGKYVKLEEIEGIIEREMKWRFDIKKNPGTWKLRQETEYKATRFMSAVFVIALHDEFGFGYKRAKRAYDELTAIWKAIHDGELSITDILAEHDRIGKRVTCRTV
jgi:hypothetical protein|nr:MAG TPA: hypothetical protein [Caudoviricetes sp.]